MKPTNRKRSSKFLKRFGIFISIFVVFIGLSLFMDDGFQNNKNQLRNQLSTSEESLIDVRIVAVGDVMVHGPQIESAYVAETGSYDFQSVFEDVKPWIQDGDLSIVNLETTLGGSDNSYSGYPVFNSPDEIIDALDYAGFDTVISANNHSMDTGIEGLRRTVQVVRQKGLEPVGTYDKEPDTRVLLKNVKGIKIAILSYTEILNGINVQNLSEEINSSINIIDEERILSDIADAKSLDPDLILAYMHWGDEYAKELNDVQTYYSELLTREGVDIILGSHPHVIQESQILEVGGNEAFVAYSLGNFLSNQRRETLGQGMEETEDGVILNLDIQKNTETGEIRIKDVAFIPTWVCRNDYEVESDYTYRILPIEFVISDSDYPKDYIHRMENSYRETLSRID